MNADSALRHEPANPLQMLALRGMIESSPDASPLAKRAVLWLLGQTRNLTHDVVAFFLAEDGSREIHFGVDDMHSAGRSTHLSEKLSIIFPTEKPHIVGHSAYEGGREGNSIWISRRELWDPRAETVTADMKAIHAIHLPVQLRMRMVVLDGDLQHVSYQSIS